MSQDTDRKRTIEARLDKLEKRLQKAADENYPSQRNIIGAVRGTLDLLRDVLLADEPQPMTREQAEALTKRAT